MCILQTAKGPDQCLPGAKTKWKKGCLIQKDKFEAFPPLYLPSSKPWRLLNACWGLFHPQLGMGLNSDNLNMTGEYQGNENPHPGRLSATASAPGPTLLRKPEHLLCSSSSPTGTGWSSPYPCQATSSDGKSSSLFPSLEASRVELHMPKMMLHYYRANPSCDWRLWLFCWLWDTLGSCKMDSSWLSMKSRQQTAKVDFCLPGDWHFKSLRFFWTELIGSNLYLVTILGYN